MPRPLPRTFFAPTRKPPTPTNSRPWPPSTTGPGRPAGGCPPGRWPPTSSAAPCRTARRSARNTWDRRRLVEIAVASLATDRGLLLLGVPGTAKTWLGEHLAAAISGTSTLVVQGTAGTPEEALRYGWNYARLLADGPSRAALVAGTGDAGHGVRQPGPGGGAHPDPVGRAGFPHHDHEREDPADPRTQRRSAGAQGIQRHRHGQQPRQGRQRPVIGAAPPVQHRGACRCPTASTRKSRSSPPACAALARPWSFRPTLRHSRRSAAWSRSCGNCAPASPRTSAPPSSRRRPPCPPQKRSRS